MCSYATSILKHLYFLVEAKIIQQKLFNLLTRWEGFIENSRIAFEYFQNRFIRTNNRYFYQKSY